MQKPSVSFAVIVLNESKNILGLLKSIAELESPFLVETLIIDNASEDDTRNLVQSFASKHPQLNLKLLERTSNHMAEARNLAIQEAKGDWIYFTDGDCRVQFKAWQQAMTFLSQLEDRSEIAAFGGGNITPVTNSFVSQGLLALRNNWWGHMGSIQVAPPEKIKPVQLLSTCNLFLNKDWAQKCEGFDSSFARVGEDLSLCHRLQKVGGELWSVPGIEVVHEQDRGLWRWLKKMFFYGKAQVDVALKYPQHFRGLRGVQFLSLLLLLATMALAPKLFMGIAVFAILVLFNGFRRSSLSIKERLLGIAFIILTQAFYAVGELSAILFLPLKILFTLPARMPILENAKKRPNPG